jgi:hypothetical protein
VKMRLQHKCFHQSSATLLALFSTQQWCELVPTKATHHGCRLNLFGTPRARVLGNIHERPCWPSLFHTPS